MRYEIGRGGEDEPGLILISDNFEHVIVARSSEMGLKSVEELVCLANIGASQQQDSDDNAFYGEVDENGLEKRKNDFDV